jgi:hypothetical protein
LLDHLFEGEPESRAWFERWCAYPLQHPGAKLYSACLLWGRFQGTGKTALAYALGKIHGKRNFKEIKNKDLHGGFNGWLAQKTLIYGDEITANDARVDSEYMKGLITQEHALINEKFQVPYSLTDHANYLFSSNNPDGLFIQDNDRRYFVHEIENEPLPDAFYHERLDDWLNNGPRGPAALFHHLLNLNMAGFAPKAPALLTKAKENMRDLSRSDVGRWVAKLKDDPNVLHVNGTPLFRLYSTSELLAIYDPNQNRRVTANGLGKELMRQGIQRAAKGSPIRTINGQQRLWLVGPDATKLRRATVSEVATIYNTERAEAKRGTRKF